MSEVPPDESPDEGEQEEIDPVRAELEELRREMSSLEDELSGLRDRIIALEKRKDDAGLQAVRVILWMLFLLVPIIGSSILVYYVVFGL